MYPGQLTGNGRRLEAKDEASKLVGINWSLGIIFLIKAKAVIIKIIT